MKKVTEAKRGASWRWFAGLYAAGVLVLLLVTLLLKFTFGWLAA
ncbi:hypothetical protein [Thiomicrospira sp. XS5]|nr:hypothetical protein [Thiomicrospira sp. XS5]